MTYGILIGLIIVGLLLIIGNFKGADKDPDCAKGLSLGVILFMPSLLGLIGKIIEAVT